MNDKRIIDIYSGKPDAKDEVGFGGITGFVSSVVIPETFNLKALLIGDSCFITGYKGTGKTALLFYLEYLIKKDIPYACTSFIFFKDEFTETKKQELDGFSQRILSSVFFDNETLVGVTDFEFIWRWLFLKRIVSDNDEYGENLFVKDSNWIEFKKVVDRIREPLDKRKSIIPQKIKIAIPYKDTSSQVEFGPELEVDFAKSQNDYNYTQFVELINRAEGMISKLTRTDTPYFIFVDELEAYYGNEKVFKRDLCFIRDLLFTVKRFNHIFVVNNLEMKIICSARTEVINAISRFVISKELNKIINGFEVPLLWNYSNTTSHQHPIVQILLKRIFMAENNEILNYKDIYARWFPEKINDIEPAGYILNNGWNKPRDIVRLITSAQNNIKANEKSFSQAVFNAIRKKYSIDSLGEIKEELRALYKTEEIDIIINCFTGFKTIFSVDRLKKRICTYYQGSIMDTSFITVIQDLYRLGFLGNYLPATKTYRWQHKSDEGVIISPEWRLMVHYALQSALSVGSKQNYSISRMTPIETGDIVNAVVTQVIPSFVIVEINYYGKKYNGQIHISRLNLGYVKDIFDVVSEGDEFVTQVLDYNEKYKCWNLCLDYNPEPVCD